MPLLDMFVNSYALLDELRSSPILLLPVAVLSAYFGWRVVEFIPFTRRIIERRESGN
ncbi:hypothetical protein [Microbispora sp. ATCC PTA-5024]|uniref:hypothetical protein n=1 Tax=Microbispora sp. ATCC PTA-5024 TaxID=316330 RepID=UPI0003DD4A3D|nr:hypothetical protein [Microbispora sp. ATCC PTA-5024]ETK33263.1 hypothetical protein MPTA5024_25435 [Microbispora sp. ATCC PTA-5024]